MHERGSSQLNDYFFVRYEKRFFNEKLLVAPLGFDFDGTIADTLDQAFVIYNRIAPAYNCRELLSSLFPHQIADDPKELFGCVRRIFNFQ